MTTFDDLINDLRNESLLDEYFAHPFENIKKNSFEKKSLLVAANPESNDLISYHPLKKQLVLPNFHFLKKDSASTFIKDNLSIIVISNDPDFQADNFPNFNLKKLKKRFPVKLYTKSILCQKCDADVPFYFRHCRNCREKKIDKYLKISICVFLTFLTVCIILLISTI